MKNTNLYNHYNFLYLDLKNYHYTDNRKGSPLNFLALLLKGTAKIVTQKKTLMLNEGDVFFIPKNLSYESFWYGNSDIKFISLGYSNLATNIDASFDLQILQCDEALKEKILNVPTIVPDNSPVNTLPEGNRTSCKALSIFYDIMSDIIPMLIASSKNGTLMTLEKIKTAIRLNPFLSLSQIAAECNISEPYLYTLFKKHEDSTPNAYRLKILCDIAVEQLTTTDKKIEQIASELNFSSGSYFRKILKNHTGHTPSEIRKNRSLIL